MTKIKTIKMLDGDDVRNACIKNGWYDNGTCEEYENLINIARHKQVTPNLLYKLAADIVEHTEDFIDNGYTRIENVENVMFNLNKHVTEHFIIIEE